MAYLQIEDPLVHPQPYVATTELSDGRFVELKFGLAGGVPVISVFYYDPLQEEIGAGQPNTMVTARNGEEASSRAHTSILSGIIRAIRRILHSCFPDLDSLWPLGIVTGLMAVLVVGVWSWARREVAPTPTAASLLVRSLQSEEAQIAGGGAIHATFSLETRSQDGRLLDTQKVDSWKSLKPRRSALRLLDGEGRTVAGRWRDPSGKTTTFAKGRGLRSDDITPAAIVDRDSAWAMVPGEETLSELEGVSDQPTLRSVGGGYDIDYRRTKTQGVTGILETSLVLDPSTLQTVAETVTVGSDRGNREYRFKQLTYEVVPSSEERDSDFVPAATLISLHPGTSRAPDVINRPAHLALQAFQLLSNLGPEVESLVDLDRLPDGTTQISGVLPTQQQKVAIIHVFQSLPSQRQLKLALHSGDEPSAATVSPVAIKLEELEPVALDGEHIPFDAELRSSLSAQGISGSSMDERIDQIASETLAHTARMHREAWTVSQLAAKDFSPSEIRMMPPEDKMLWLTLLDRHVRTLDQELNYLDGYLKPLTHMPDAQLPPPPSPSPPLQSVNELGAASEVLNRNGQRLDRLLTAGLTLSTSSRSTNRNVAEIAELLADLRIEESMLHATVERLQTASPSRRTE
jgi:hypothetical protein